MSTYPLSFHLEELLTADKILYKLHCQVANKYERFLTHNFHVCVYH